MRRLLVREIKMELVDSGHGQNAVQRDREQRQSRELPADSDGNEQQNRQADTPGCGSDAEGPEDAYHLAILSPSPGCF